MKNQKEHNHHEHPDQTDQDQKHDDHQHHKGDGHNHSDHHAMMIADFRKRFWVALFVSFPILLLSPMIQGLLGYSLSFIYSEYVLFGLSAFVFFYGGWPFITGL